MKGVSYVNYIKTGKRVLLSDLSNEERQDVACKLQMQFMKGFGGYEPSKRFLKEHPQYQEYWDNLV